MCSSIKSKSTFLCKFLYFCIMSSVSAELQVLYELQGKFWYFYSSLVFYSDLSGRTSGRMALNLGIPICDIGSVKKKYLSGLFSPLINTFCLMLGFEIIF